MKQPTEQERNEVWEWCGLIHINNLISPEAANSCEAVAMDKPINGWYKPDYQNGTSRLISLRNTLDIDLNNLFQYAIPKAREYLKDEYLGFSDLMMTWLGDILDNEDPALALFWAIKSAMEAK